MAIILSPGDVLESGMDRRQGCFPGLPLSAIRLEICFQNDSYRIDECLRICCRTAIGKFHVIRENPCKGVPLVKAMRQSAGRQDQCWKFAECTLCNLG